MLFCTTIVLGPANFNEFQIFLGNLILGWKKLHIFLLSSWASSCYKNSQNEAQSCYEVVKYFWNRGSRLLSCLSVLGSNVWKTSKTKLRGSRMELLIKTMCVLNALSAKPVLGSKLINREMIVWMSEMIISWSVFPTQNWQILTRKFPFLYIPENSLYWLILSFWEWGRQETMNNGAITPPPCALLKIGVSIWKCLNK